MYKKCKVCMLSTNEKAPLIIGKTKFLFLNDRESAFRSIQDAAYQHLYILSDDETKASLLEDGILLSQSDIYRNIIASTDSSLNIQFKDGSGSYSMPSIPQSFIEKYISEYNKGNKIEEVMVEYNELYQFPDGSCSISAQGMLNIKMIEKIKLNPDNTITIKPIKDNWTREEVANIIRDYRCRILALINMKHEVTNTFTENFIESNL